MSHVTTLELEVTDLDALREAAEVLGMEMVKAETFRWYGRHIGDYPRPAGYTAADDGKCAYALRIKGMPTAYEVGVNVRKDGKPGYALLWDFFMGGKGLQKVIGKDGVNLRMEYAMAVATKKANARGMRVRREVNAETGRPRLVMSRGGR